VAVVLYLHGKSIDELIRVRPSQEKLSVASFGNAYLLSHACESTTFNIIAVENLNSNIS